MGYSSEAGLMLVPQKLNFPPMRAFVTGPDPFFSVYVAMFCGSFTCFVNDKRLDTTVGFNYVSGNRPAILSQLRYLPITSQDF